MPTSTQLTAETQACEARPAEITRAMRARLYGELAEVTPAMVLAGVEAALQATTMIDDQGRRQFRSGVSTGTEYAAIWQAMLRAKLGLK